MSKNVQFEDNTRETTERIKKGSENAIPRILINVERKILEAFFKFPKPPIDSGQLRNSVTHRVTNRGAGEVSAGGGLQKMYAPFIEFGTVKMPARPFFRNGINDARDSNDEIIRNELLK